MKLKNLKTLFLMCLMFNEIVMTSESQLPSSMIVTTIVLPRLLRLKTVDHLYPFVKVNQGVEKFVELAQGVDLNQKFSLDVISKFESGSDVPDLTVLQLAVLYNRLDIVEYLLSIPNIEINETDSHKAVLDYCDFYNLIPIVDSEFKARLAIREKLCESGACHSKRIKSLLAKNGPFSIKVQKIDI